MESGARYQLNLTRDEDQIIVKLFFAHVTNWSHGGVLKWWLQVGSSLAQRVERNRF